MFPLLIGIAGWCLAWSLWHLYLDHALFHALTTPRAVASPSPEPVK